ncbi:efflux RND transporter permease subunit [Aliikangiella sp. G2MR2-5]|uniref:efflux RND transporter permease subunit n=1 Tax=Aliikangiella sp. G2MR2-5 TaxID=2788943 RepID=UPI0018AA3E5D|nr:efflux RND transporter permease subunit [Aliikangiella sp. G2MR2-5]
MNIIAVAIRRPVTVAMFTLAALVFGLVLVNRLGFNLLPELSYPTLTVRTDFEGAAPQEVENLITRPLEGLLGTIKGLKQLRSVSKAGRSDIYLEFHWGTNIDLASLDVREKMEQVQLPLEVSPPSLLRFNPNSAPIIRMSLSQKLNEGDDPQASLASLRRYADQQLSRRLETIEGVAATKASGGLEDEIQILLDQNQLAQLNITVENIANKLRTQNINMSGGQIRNGQQQLLVRTFNEYRSVDDFANTIVISSQGRVVRLKDIAEIKATYKDPTAIIRHNGEQAVEIAIYKEGDANTVKVAEAVNGQLKSLIKEIGKEKKLTVLTDASKFIDQAISELVSSAIIGGLLAMIIIYLFLGEFGPTVIISATIPLSVIITFNLMFSAHIDMNIMSLGGLALAVGMLVDNAIVVLENISRKKEQGLSTSQAAFEGATEVSGAITASTLTTIAVFLPLIFVEGIAGQLFKDQALTITFSLIVSLAVALTLIPTMAAHMKERKLEKAVLERSQKPVWLRLLLLPIELIIAVFALIFLLFKLSGRFISLTFGNLFRLLKRVLQTIFKPVPALYDRLLSAALEAKTLTLVVAFGLLGLSLMSVQQIPKVVLPEMAQGELVVKVQYTPGTAIEMTDIQVIDLSKKLSSLEGIKEVFATAGAGNKLTANPEQEGENQAEFTLLLNKGISREGENQLLNEIRRILAEESKGLNADAERPQLFSFSTPISIEIYGFEIDTLKESADLVIQKLSKSDRFVDLHTNMKSGYPEAQVIFDQEKMASLGLSIEQANTAVVNSIRGNKATRYRLRDRQIDVLVRLNDSSRDEINDVKNLIINPTSSRPIPLHAVAEIVETQGPSEIMRIDQQRVILVEGQILYGGINEAILDAQNKLDGVVLPRGVSMLYGGQGEEMESSYQSLLMALGLAVFMVYLVMASQFESLLHPFIILLSIPLAIIGAVGALIISNTELSVVVFLGLIMLAGIVVNNAIVLIDRINQLRLAGEEKLAAIKQAAESRLRPILMTTLTTTLGMLPLAMGIGEGAEMRAPMAITVIGGLLVSTFLTLIVIPVMYQILDRKDYSRKMEIETSTQIEQEA